MVPERVAGICSRTDQQHMECSPGIDRRHMEGSQDECFRASQQHMECSPEQIASTRKALKMNVPGPASSTSNAPPEQIASTRKGPQDECISAGQQHNTPQNLFKYSEPINSTFPRKVDKAPGNRGSLFYPLFFQSSIFSLSFL